MKKTMMMMAFLASGMIAYAGEKNDTTVIENAKKVIVIAGDSLQTVRVNGKEGDSKYYYENTISTKGAKTVKKRVFDTDNFNWDFDLAFGLPIATNVPGGMSFAPFKSYEWILGFRYKYTPKKALQTYSVGLWCNWRQYTLDTNKMFDKDAASGVISVYDYPANASDKRSGIYVFGLSVPFLFTQKFGKKSPFRFSLGPVVNFNLYGRICNEYTLDDYVNEVKIKGIDYRPVTVDIMGLLSYSHVSLYCKYSPMSVLKENSANGIENPQFRSISVGLFF